MISKAIKKRWINSTFSSFISCLVGLFISLVIILSLSEKPFETLSDFFTGVFSSSYYLGAMLNTASLFMWAGIGGVLAILSGNLNLGGEGQIYFSGFASAIILSCDFISLNMRVFIALFTACLSGALSALVPALLKYFRGTSELLTSFLVSAMTIPLIDSAISGRFRDSSRNLLATKPVPESLQLKSILEPSPLNISFFLALLFCCIIGIILYRTTKGKRFILCGAAPEFAHYAGFSVAKNSFLGMIFSGMCHGLSGFFAVLGTFYTCHSGFYVGMGWNALSCALIARSNPFAIIPVSLLLSWIFTAVDRTSMINGFTFDLEGLIQMAILFFISANFIRRKNGVSS